MNKKQKRQEEILTYMQEHGDILVSTICRKFNVVEMTARRDLNELEKKGAIIRNHGGAISIEKKTFDAQTPLNQRLKIHYDEKNSIAKKAIELVCPNDKIFIASGSTISLFAQNLIHHVSCTVLTNALNIGYTLSQDPYIRVIMLGGELRINALSLTGDITQNQLKQFACEKAFIGVNAIDSYGKLYTSSVVESDLLEELFENVKHVYVLADKSKLFKEDLVEIKNKKGYTLITNAQLSNDKLDVFHMKNIQLITI